MSATGIGKMADPRFGQTCQHESSEIFHFPFRPRGQAERAAGQAQAPLKQAASLAGFCDARCSSAVALDNGDRIGLAIIVPVYGQHHLTRAVLQDLRYDGSACTVYIVDNGGDYRAVGEEHVLRSGTNLHWAGGCNFGLLSAQERGHAGYVLLNNDVRLSHGFANGLLEAWRDTDAALVGPVYDDNWPQQRISYAGPADAYDTRQLDRVVPFIDGTCMLIPDQTLRQVGLLDERTWPRYGWGCDKDYALRTRQAGGSVWVTERSYLNHLGRQTAAKTTWYNEQEAEAENDAGMAAKWGPAWKDLLYAGFGNTPREGVVQQRIAH
jgi:GT2 family glycosyltransferase